jgi:hypothetical protein
VSLGSCLVSGCGVPRDITAGLAYITKAADKGHGVAQSMHNELLGTDTNNTAGRTMETHASASSQGMQEMMDQLMDQMMQCVVCGGDNARKQCGFCKAGLVGGTFRALSLSFHGCKWKFLCNGSVGLFSSRTNVYPSDPIIVVSTLL